MRRRAPIADFTTGTLDWQASLWDGNSGKEGLLNRLWQLGDVQFSVVAVLDQAGRVMERVEYSPYGVARNMPIGDFTGDGTVTTGDLYGSTGVFDGLLPAFFAAKATGDWDRSGVPPTQQDIFAFLADWFEGQSVAARVSPNDLSDRLAIDNPIGYCGYAFNRESADYCVRFRHYAPDYGRWLERDPAGYVDGGSLVGYGAMSPLVRVDPFGLVNRILHDGYDVPLPAPPEPRWSPRATGTSNCQASADQLLRIASAYANRCGGGAKSSLSGVDGSDVAGASINALGIPIGELESLLDGRWKGARDAVKAAGKAGNRGGAALGIVAARQAAERSGLACKALGAAAGKFTAGSLRDCFRT
jgi:RHS repeat-associated protein